MEKRKVGKTDIEVSTLGMGCWAYGGGSYWGEQSQDIVNRTVALALDMGVNYFDTAEVYNDGASETSLGIALRERRHEAVIGSKVSTSNTRPDTLRLHCENSLKRLGTDYIDIYMLHWPINPSAVAHFSSDPDIIANPPSVDDAFETLIRLKEEGKIREIGVSNHGVKQMDEVLRACPDIAVNELPYNLISRAVEREIMPKCVENNIGVLGYMALQQGVLTGCYKDFSDIPASQAHSRHFRAERGGDMSRHTEPGAEDEILALLRVMKKISDELGISESALAIAWTLRGEGITSSLVGSRDENELRANIKAAEYRLPDDAYNELNKASEPVWDKLGDNPDFYQNREDSRIW